MSKLKVNNLEPLSGNIVSIASDLAVDGTLTAKVLRTELTQSAILYESGSSKFGDTYDDLHQFTGSIQLDGFTEIKGNDNKIKFFYPTLATLPPADVWHGMFAHVHSEGKAFYAHGGSWVPLSDEADVTALSASIDNSINNLSSSVDTSINNLSSSVDNSIVALSSSAAIALSDEITALSASSDAQLAFVSESSDVQRKYLDSKNYVAIDALSGSAQSARTIIDSDLKAKIVVQRDRIDAILSSSVADTDTFAEIVTLINSVDTENDTAFAGFVTSSNQRIDANGDSITALSSSAATANAELEARAAQANADLSAVLNTEILNNDAHLSGSVLVVTDTLQAGQDNNAVKISSNKLLIDNIEAITGSLLDTQTEWNNKKDQLTTSSSVAGAYLSTVELKDIVSGSADFIEFQAKIAAL
jgi:hypothetical protein